MFGAVVRAYRLALGLTQEDLADRAALSVRCVGKIENGRIATPRPHTVQALADALELAGADRARFLRSARGSAGAQPVSALPVGSSVIPAQLPADVLAFTGREAELNRLDQLCAGLRPEAPSARSGGPVSTVAVVSGMAGVGKTALAIRWAHRVRHLFPDGQLYVNLHGFAPEGRPVTSAEAVRAFLHSLGVPPERVPPDLDGQAALYRSLLDDRRMLIVLDNARDAGQVRPLLPGSATARVVVTSRSQLTGLVAVDGAHLVDLDLLNQEEARELLARRLGTQRITAEPRATTEIVDRCARLPLALMIVAARSTQTGFPLATLAADLTKISRLLDILDAGDPASRIRAVFSWSLTSLSTAAARLFRLLGLHTGTDITAPAAASLAGLPPDLARRLLTELVDASLLTEHLVGRFVMHDLLHAYAVDLVRGQEPHDQRHAATVRLLDHYLHSAYAADRLVHPARDPITRTAPEPEVTPEQHPDAERAMAWLTRERAVLLTAVRQAAAARLDTRAWQLAWSLHTVLVHKGPWHDLITVWEIALDAAGRLNDSSAQAEAHRSLGWAHTLMERHLDAHTHLCAALDLFTRDGNHIGQAYTHNALATLAERRGDLEEALVSVQRALALFETSGHRKGQARALNGVGWYQALLGNHAEAITVCERALPLLQELGDRDGEAGTWDSLGFAHHQVNGYAQAVECYRQALALFRVNGDRFEEAATLIRLGDTYHADGNTSAARSTWDRALDILNSLSHPRAACVRTKLIALEREAAASEPATVRDHGRQSCAD